MTLFRMPDEILAMVFQNLSHHELAMSSRVCSRFHSLHVNCLYRDIAFQAPSHHAEERASTRDVFKFYSLLRTLAAMPDLTSNIKSFYLQAWHVTAFFNLFPTTLHKSLGFPSLSILELEYGSMTIQNLKGVLQTTPMLRCLYCKFTLDYESEDPLDRCFDLEMLAHALKLVSNTLERAWYHYEYMLR